MKRKIAILLSGIMVASAMPMTASAAKLSIDGIRTPSFAKVNEPIDINAYNRLSEGVAKSEYEDFKNAATDIDPPYSDEGHALPAPQRVVNNKVVPAKGLPKEDLKNRKSFLKIDLAEDFTSNVLKKPTFRITLENGSFDETYLENYLYINTSGGKAVSWEDAVYGQKWVDGQGYTVYGPEGKKSKGTDDAPTVSEIFTNIATANTKDKEPTEQTWNKESESASASILDNPDDPDRPKTAISKGLAKVKKAMAEIRDSDPNSDDGKSENYKLKYDSATTTLYDTAGVSSNNDEGVQITNKVGTVEGFLAIYNHINKTKYESFTEFQDAVIDECVKEISPSGGNNTDILPHLPYTFERVSDKEAIVTVNATITDADVKNGSTVKIKNRIFNKSKCTGIRLTSEGSSNTGYTVEELANIKQVVVDINNDYTSEDKNEEVDLKLDDTPYIALPLGGVVADSEGEVKATITTEYTDKVNSKEVVLNKNSSEGTGSTSLVYSESNIRTFEDQVELGKVLIKENSRNTIGKDTEITTNKDNKLIKNGVKDSLQFDIKLNSGFKFTNKTKSADSNEIDHENEIKLGLESSSATTSANLKEKLDIKAEYINENHIRVTMNAKSKQNGDKPFEDGLESFGADRQYPIGISVEKLDIKPVSDNIYGEATITVSGDGINTQTKTVARREKLGFKLSTLKDPKPIVSGRHYTQDTRNMTDSDNTTVEIQFSEGVPNTLVESRNLDFTLPEGVKIADAEIYDYKNLKNIGDNNFEILNNGRTLRLRRIDNTNDQYGSKYSVVDKVNKVANFKMKLDLSVEPGFEGDIKLGVTGGGQSDTVEAVVAKAINPVKVETSTTKANLGYQDYNTANITITENRPGMLLSDREVRLSLIAPYGVQEVGFSQANFEVGGNELSIKDRDFKVKDGVIRFRVDRSSHKNPATITIKDVKIGSTRSVPYGSYNLSLSGDAVINNYQKGGKDDRGNYTPFIYDKEVSVIDNKYNTNNLTSNTSNSAADTQRAMNGLRVQDKLDHYEIKDYVNVVTETGTFDKTVKVTVGDKTALIGDQTVDMDVAPYIQASSNSTMVPLRFVSLALGVDTSSVANPDASNKIAYDVNTKTTTIYYGAGTGQKIIQFQAGSNIMTVDGTRIPMEYGVKAEIKDSRMFVPFRALGQALGIQVDWDANSRTAIYNADNARNVNNNTTTATESTTQSTTASDSSTQSTTASDSTTQSTTASDGTTQSTTAKQ